MFELLPRTGIVLPCGAGTLAFGMAERPAQWTLATLCDVRETWVCGLNWSFSAEYGGVSLLIGSRHGEGMDYVVLDRIGDAPSTSATTPVVWQDIDLFGHPHREVAEALGDVPVGVRLTRPAGPGTHLSSVRLTAAAP
ncbi:hypothetical protein V7793_02620 [Streptomyces sp. KLMMK]|uniref:hypothetical protein n=1 Tax=Streptomyces sp. KLMMK TaxID=3109353 RepID=UPI002FFFDC5C